MNNIEDKEKIKLMSEIVKLALSGKSDVIISKTLSLPVIQVFGVRRFWGIGRRRSIDIFNEWKLASNLCLSMGLTRVYEKLGLNPMNKYKFMASAYNNKTKEITLKFAEA